MFLSQLVALLINRTIFDNTLSSIKIMVSSLKWVRISLVILNVNLNWLATVQLEFVSTLARIICATSVGKRVDGMESGNEVSVGKLRELILDDNTCVRFKCVHCRIDNK